MNKIICALMLSSLYATEGPALDYCEETQQRLSEITSKFQRARFVLVGSNTNLNMHDRQKALQDLSDIIKDTEDPNRIEAAKILVYDTLEHETIFKEKALPIIREIAHNNEDFEEFLNANLMLLYWGDDDDQYDALVELRKVNWFDRDE